MGAMWSLVEVKLKQSITETCSSQIKGLLMTKIAWFC